MKTIKRITALILSVMLLLSCCLSVGFLSYAEELRYFERGVLTDGTNTAYYIIDKDNKVLYITGDGNHNARTPNYPSAAEGPFAGRTDVTRIVIEEDVEKIGDYALSNMTKVDTLEVQSNLLSSSSSMSSKAMIGCTGLRHIQGDNSLLSTDVFLEVIKGAVNIASGNWLSLVKNGISIISTGVTGDNTLDNDTVHCMVDDYINNGNKIFLDDLATAQEAYNARLANPCYSNNAFHHSYQAAVTTQPTCTAAGETTYTCPTCGDVYTEPVTALGHVYTATTLYERSCFVEGITKYSCTQCGDAMYQAIPAIGHHTYDSYTYDAAADAYTEICAVCDDHNTQFDNDTSALIYAVDLAEALDSSDYTTDSYQTLYNAVERYLPLEETDYLQYPQVKVDEKVAEILTKLDALVPYLNLRLSYQPGGIATVIYEDVTAGAGKQSVTFGTEVTLTATPAAGYTFNGWYEKTTRRILSEDEVYTFSMTSNTDILARFIANDEATLYFTCLDGQLKSYVTKTTEEWRTVTSLEALLPEVPYSYGHTDGAWRYNEPAVLATLSSGEDVTVMPTYTDVAIPTYEKPQSTDGVTPALTLYYEYDAAYNVGNFIMMADVPEDCPYEEIGIAFYYKNADTFNPTALRLLMNNKMVTSRFDTLYEDGKYVVNFKKMSAGKNYAAKGYVSYYDADGNLQVVYTDQVNIVNLAQAN